MQAGQFSEAKILCEEILALSPAHIESTMVLAEIAIAEKDLTLASGFYATVIARNPNEAVSHYRLANVLRDRDLLDTALHHYDQAVLLDPKYANAYCNRGVVLQRLNRLQEALASYEAAILLNPADAMALFNRGTLLRELKREEDALASFDLAIAASPTYVAAFYNRGMLLQELRRWDAALAEYDKALKIEPRFAQCHVARGNLQRVMGRPEAALADFDTAIALDIRCVAAYSGKGAALGELKQFPAAFDALNLAIGIDPDFADAHCNLGNLLLRLNQFGGAVESYDRAVELKPDFSEAHNCRGESLLYMGRFAAAAESFDRVVALRPHDASALLMRRHAMMHLCDWTNVNSEIKALTLHFDAGSAAVPPLAILALVDSPRLHLRIAQDVVREGRPPDDSLSAIPRVAGSGRIRVGYFSADFFEHPVAMLAAQFLELHDRSRYEVVGFSFGPDTQDPMRKRLEKSFDRFVEVRGKSDREVALLARSMGIDIAVDLNGHTAGSRTGIFALRAAPVQISFLGYPGTMGAGYIDYLIGDATVIPEEYKQHYAEKIIFMPDSFLPHDSGRAIASHRFTREQLGLPPSGVVFCCFNNSYKIMPDTFGTWMKILGRVAGSVLWLSHNNATAAENLRREAQNRGVDPQRLIFAERMPSAAEHLSRLRAADLFLDTLPYNAHATALDALWSGLPLLTCIGQGFAGRVAASLLKAVGLPELITPTLAQYEELAVALAHDPHRLMKVRQRLEENRLTMPLFDTVLFTQNLEKAYARVHERYQAGLATEHVHPG